MSFVKSYLKSARDAISKKDYANAKKSSLQVLDYEPENYNAHVFLGLALLELGEYNQSEEAYEKAIKLNSTHPLAYQGLSSFYEKRENWKKYAATLIQLMMIFNASEDAVKCAETLQKIVAAYRKHGEDSEIIQGLSYYLPESPVYALLSTLPRPDPTNPTGTSTFEAQDAVHNGLPILEEIIQLTEKIETGRFNREFASRRTRLGAPPPDVLQKDIQREISADSKLPTLYDAILNHPSTSDDLRRTTETKLLRHRQNYLASIPSTPQNQQLKQQLLSEVEEMVKGIVLLEKPDEPGWLFHLEGLDVEDFADYDRGTVRQYIRLFPNSRLANLFKGYFAYYHEELWTDEEELKAYALQEDEDPLDFALAAGISLPDTIIGNRLTADLYLQEQDYESAIKTAKVCLQVLQTKESETGRSLPSARIALQVIQATALVHFYPPKHHKTAASILAEVLGKSPNNTTALMDQGYILEAASSWSEAAAVFDKVVSLISDDIQDGLRAREEAAWSRYQSGEVEAGIAELEQTLAILENLDDETRKPDCARCMWRIGKGRLETGDTETAFKKFIGALKQDSRFAPAFTSLGVYYHDYADPPDPARSSKCFQKAFELDARETLAAQKLAEGFADDREWDLVDVVAQRTIDGEGGLNAGMDKAEGDTTRYLPSNSWAWKALGVVKLHYRDYAAAIQAFQISLRVHPEDQVLWVRLGEAYARAGRHAAALKALKHAHEMAPDDWLCSYYIADVEHLMGNYQSSIDLLEDIRKKRPDEPGVLFALAQSQFDLGRSQYYDGLQIRSEACLLSAIETALSIAGGNVAFRSLGWKIIADSIFQLSHFSAFTNNLQVLQCLRSIKFLQPPESSSDLVKTIVRPSLGTEDGNELEPLKVNALAVHAYLCVISVQAVSQTPQSSAWYDLGVSIHSWIDKAPPSIDAIPIRESVVEYLKKAIQLDDARDEYWIALGHSYFKTNPRAAQHAYIKAIDIDSKNAMNWVSLGLLYYYHGDVELANEALYRAQVLDPDNALAWIGQFLVATANKHHADANLLLEHAVGLVGSVPAADYEFAFKAFESITVKKDTRVDSLLTPFFLLERFTRQRPNDASGLHLFALVCERLGHFDLGETLIQKAISILEAAYEETEDPEVETRYTIANAGLGRLRLAGGDYAGCVESFSTVLGLLTEKTDPLDDTVRVLKVQAHLFIGLAQYFAGDLGTALQFLEDGLEVVPVEDASGNLITKKMRGHLMIVLAQTLWAIGSDEAKETAKGKLFECITEDPDNLEAITILAGMGILTADDGLIDAALSEILALPIDQKLEMDPQHHVDYLLIQHHLALGEIKKALSIAQQAVRNAPASLEQRNTLARLCLQIGSSSTSADADRQTAFALLAGTDSAGDKTNKVYEEVGKTCVALGIQAVVLASSPKGGEESKRDGLKKAQKGIFLRPSSEMGWQTLVFVRAQVES
ncbi:hypothetical protein CVT24_009721 [Panaeolus cyanescens]|uniref:Superkiller protein 3 n=1 Tax=Panaeolus cyanescens TaxID=181874 RepID=A0A409Y9Q5_9AGAR|nr:hypothetical protein CVT24_009721 [Panaeolus cyanescens]